MNREQKFIIKIILMMLLLIIFIAQAFASQNPTQLPTASPYAGLTMLNNINSAFNTFQSNFSGATSPIGTGSPTTYQYWTDTTDSTVRFYDGSVWQPIGRWSGSQWTPVSNGVPDTLPTSTGSSNAYVVTYSPVPAALVTGQHYPFIANFQNTSAVTLNVNSLGAKPIKKQGGTALISADIVNGAAVDTIYDGTNFQMTSQLGNSNSGTITSIATNNGITGGTITTSGTIGLATTANQNILSNISGSTAVPSGNNISVILDNYVGSTQGEVPYRGSGGWTSVGPGTNGYPLLTGGGGSNPSWAKLPVTSISAGGTPSGSTYLRGDGNWASAVSIPTPLGVGSMVMACFIGGSGTLHAGDTLASTLIQVVSFFPSPSSPSSFIITTSGDSITGTWQSMQTMSISGGGGCTTNGAAIGLFQRIS